MKKFYLFITALLCCFGSNALALDQVDGVYQIGTAADLKAFADLVNSTEPGAKGVLTADITGYEGDEAYMMGQPSLAGAFSGTLDGQNHKLTYNLSTTRGYAGLFRYVNGGTIKNLILEGTLTMSGANAVGGTVVGCFIGTGITMEKVVSYVKIIANGTYSDATAGGLIGCAENQITDNGTKITNANPTLGGTITDCAFYGEIAATGKTGNCGIMGYSNNTKRPTIKNCIVWCTLASGGTTGDICRSAYATVTNCYTESTNRAAFANKKGTEATATQIGSGEIAYKLNGSVDNGVWHQKIGIDDRPLPYGDDATLVLKDGDTYKNPSGAETFDIPISSLGKADDGFYYASLYYSDKALVVPAGVEAQTYRVVDGELTVSKTYAAEEVIPAGQAVIVRTANNGTFQFVEASTAGTSDANSMLFGSDEEKSVGESGYLYYMLSTPPANSDYGIGFWWQTEGGQSIVNGAHKAYLRVAETTASGAKGFSFGGNTTGVKTVDGLTSRQVDESWYTLDGQKLNAQPMQKGVYIVNGKKVVVK